MTLEYDHAGFAGGRAARYRPALLWAGQPQPPGGRPEFAAIDVIHRRAYLLSILGRWEEAESALNDCRSFSGLEGRAEFDCRVMLVLAGIMINQGRLEEADDALKVCQSGGKGLTKEARMDLVNLRGKMAMYRGDLGASRGEFSFVLEYAEKHGSRLHWARAALNLGNVSVMQGEMEAAESFYQKALSASDELGDPGGVGMALGGLGILAAEKGDNRKAMDCFRRDLEIGLRLGQMQTVAQTHGNIGQLLANEGRLSEAAESYRRQLEIVREIGDAQGTFNALHCLAKCLRGLEKRVEAEEFYRRASEHGMKLSMFTESAVALLELAEMLSESGEADEAGEVLETLLQLGDKVREPETIAMARQLLAGLSASKSGQKA